MTLERPLPDQRRPWHWAAWLAWSLLVIAAFLASSFAAFVIAWGDSTSCNLPATQAQVMQGQRHVVLVAANLFVVWAVVACFSPRRWSRMLLGFVISATPLLLLALTHLRPHDWTGGFCF